MVQVFSTGGFSIWRCLLTQIWHALHRPCGATVPIQLTDQCTAAFQAGPYIATLLSMQSVLHRANDCGGILRSFVNLERRTCGWTRTKDVTCSEGKTSQLIHHDTSTFRSWVSAGESSQARPNQPLIHTLSPSEQLLSR